MLKVFVGFILYFFMFFNFSFSKENFNGIDINASTENTFFDTSKVDGDLPTYKSNTPDTEEYIKVSLVDVVLETVSQSNNVKAAREKVIQAKIKVDDAYAGYLPSIDGTYKTSRTKKRPGDANNDTNQTNERKFFNDKSYKLTITQNLYEGGATHSEIKRLKKKYDVAKNDYKLAISKEIENAVKAYFDVLFNFKSLTVNVENMQRLNEILEIVGIKYESGATTIGDLSSIKASVSNAESKLIKIESKFNEALEYYKYIVGDAFVQTFPYEDNFDTTIDDFAMLVDRAVESNIDVKNYKLEIEAEKFKLINSKSGFRPKVDLELSGEKILDQEDFTNVERNYKAQVTLTYNFYNKGRDKNKLLTSYSKIRQLKYELKEEIRKLKWTLSKLHRSIISVTNASVSTKAEVLASKEMVNAYWDGFKLGEQDLQELLQGQRQLNSAQLDLIKNKKSAITDYFKLLSNIGELLKYFRLDIDADNYIDFSRSKYKNLLKTDKDDLLSKDLELSKNNEIKKDDNTSDNNITQENTISIDENLTKQIEQNSTIIVENNTTIVKDSLNDLLKFQDQFLQSDDKWSIRLFYFDKVYQALDFVKENNISKDIFIFDTLQNNKVKTNIAYGIFDTEQLANESLDELNTTNINKKVVNIKDIKKIYNNFKNKKLQIKTKVKKQKPFQTDPAFKKKFLNANKDLYTINITSFSSLEQAKKLVQKEKIYNNSFIFSYGDEIKLIKVVYGVFETYEQASDTLDKLENIKQKYAPVIELIEIKQDLYKKYNSFKTQKTQVKKEQVIKPDEKQVEKKQTVKPDERKVDKPIKKLSIKDDFKDSFLNAPQSYFTINLATLIDKQDANRFIKRYGKNIDIFAFKFGQDTTYYKAMGGIYETKDEALEALESLDEKLKNNKPRIEQINIKQNLYFKYNSDITKDEKVED